MGRPAVVPVVPVGTVGRAHGVRGQVRIRSDMDPPEDLLRHDTWLVERAGAWRAVAVRSARPHGNVLVAHLEGIDDRDAASELAGTRVGLPRDALPALEDGQYYWVDLIGLEVLDEGGESLGVVRKMIETGANDVMVVGPGLGPGPGPGSESGSGSDAPPARGGTRAAERVIPFLIGDVVREVDLAAGHVRVLWPLDEGGP